MSSESSSPAIASMSCTRCRTRRVKCDRILPGCKRCEKLMQPCPGYNRSRRFRDEGPSLRKKFGAEDEQNTTTPNSDVTNDSPPAMPPSLPPPFLNHAPKGEEPLIPQFGEPSFDQMYFDINPDIYWAQEENSCGFVPTLSTSDIDAPLDQFSSSHAESLDELSKDGGEVQDNWLAEVFLPRRFSEVIGPWLDVMSTDKYFGHMIPLRARKSGLIKSSVAAVAAKQYGSQKQNGTNGQPEYSPQSPGNSSQGRALDWSFEAASFYDTAIRHMMRSINSVGSGYGTSPMSLSRPEVFESVEQERFGDLLAAIAIFLLYESIDDQQSSMVQHVAGAHQLLQNVVQQFFGASQSVLWSARPKFDRSFSKAWEASFWNFATFDYITSYSTRSSPRLDFADVRLWEAAGLPMVSRSGAFVPKLLIQDTSSGGQDKMSEAEACRTLLWIVIRTLALIAMTGDRGYHAEIKAEEAGPGSEAASWRQIEEHLRHWYASMPEAFELLSRVNSTHEDPMDIDLSYPSAPPSTATTIPFPQLVFTNSMATSALMLYHFTCLLVELQRIPGGRSETCRRPPPDMSRISYHAGEICGIAVGRPQAGAQVHLVQPLHLAGLCLESYRQKVVLADLLVGLQRRSGCSSVWKLKDLKKAWGWEADVAHRGIMV